MELILWRHAEAEDDNPQGDLARRLTKKGRKASKAKKKTMARLVIDATYRGATQSETITLQIGGKIPK